MEYARQIINLNFYLTNSTCSNPLDRGLHRVGYPLLPGPDPTRTAGRVELELYFLDACRVDLYLFAANLVDFHCSDSGGFRAGFKNKILTIYLKHPKTQIPFK